MPRAWSLPPQPAADILHPVDSPAHDRIIPIQALRLLAALAVVVGHAELFAWWLGRSLGDSLDRYPIGLPGGAGVDLFFVISGFVMVLSSHRLFGQPGGRALFLKRRLIRIVPPYWLATMALLAWAMLTGGLPDPATLITSLAFIPCASATANGRIMPFLEVGWTLNLEMLFYALFALLMAATARGTVRRVATVLAIMVLTGLLLPLPQPLAFWASPIVLEFAAGMALALAHARGFTLPAWLRLAVAAMAIAAVLLPVHAPGAELAGPDRLIGWGLPMVALFAAAVMGPLPLPAPALWNAGGDMSYALYLWHMPLMIVLRWLWRRADAPFGVGGQWAFIMMAVAGSLVAAWIIHRRVEVPLTRWLHRRLRAVSPAPLRG